MYLFYCPDINNTLFLDDQESFHAVKVLRLLKGDLIHIIDGTGGLYKAVISNAHPKKCEFSILDVNGQFQKRNYHIHIAIAPAKNNDRNEWFVEKATEIGIDEISFCFCERSERKIINLERMQKIAISAMKQSGNTYLPKLSTGHLFGNFIKGKNTSEKYIAHLEEGNRNKLQSVAGNMKQYLVLIGPEGDFTTAEIALASQNDFLPITLGTSRLRTETAGIAACHILNLINDL
jgi:16S rRNA (uracil1498-N3)-methyltransferase